MQDSLNTARAILVAGAAVAVMVLLFTRQWLPAALLAGGITAHAALWVYLRRSAQRDAGLSPTPPPTPGRSRR